jgi:hypothetical protein
MKKRVKNIVSIIGVILLILGVTSSIPLFLQKSYLGLVFSLISVIFGVIFLAIAFGE